MAKAKKQTSRLTKGAKKAPDGTPKREPAKKRARVARSAPMSPATSHTGSMASSSSSWAPSPLVEVPRRRSADDTSPSRKLSSFEHDAAHATDAAHGCACGQPAAFSPIHSRPTSESHQQQSQALPHPLAYQQHGRLGAAPASPVSPTWPDGPAAWRGSYEAHQRGQWVPEHPDAFPFPQPRQYQDQAVWMAPRESQYPPRPSMPHHPHSAPVTTLSSFPPTAHRHVQQQPTPPFEFHSPEESYVSTFDAYQAMSRPGELLHLHEHPVVPYQEYHTAGLFTAACDPAPPLEEFIFDSANGLQSTGYSTHEMERYEMEQGSIYGSHAYVGY